MKYLDTYNKVLENAMIKSKEADKGKKNMNYDWMLITEAFKNPNRPPKFYVEKLKDEYGVKVDEQYVKKAFKEINLNSYEKRKEMAHIASTNTDIVKGMLEGNKEAIQKMGELISRGTERTSDGRIKFKYKCTLTYMFNIDSDFKNEKYNTLLTVFKETYCGNLLRKLYRNISRKEGFTKKEDVQEVTARIQKTIDAVPVSIESIDVFGDKDKIIEKLKFEIRNYQNTIDILQSGLDDLNESVEEATKEAEKKAVSNFFMKLNSPQYGGILDNLLVVESKLKEVKKINTLLPNQLISLPIIFKQLLKFVKDIGIEPIDTVGRSFEGSYRDIDCVNYVGEPFLDDDETKMMEVQKCGWKYEDTVISIPTVKEI